jgi:hypothetical protein
MNETDHMVMLVSALLRTGHYTTPDVDPEWDDRLKRWDYGESWKEDKEPRRVWKAAIIDAADLLRDIQRGDA